MAPFGHGDAREAAKRVGEEFVADPDIFCRAMRSTVEDELTREWQARHRRAQWRCKALHRAPSSISRLSDLLVTVIYR